MPVVFRESGLRYFFYSNEGLPREPRHIHVKGGGKDAKIWLEPRSIHCRQLRLQFRRIGAYLTDGFGTSGPDFASLA
jgi:hypothetical protein